MTEHNEELRMRVANSPLENHVLEIGVKALRALNPDSLAPSYIFIDEDRRIRDQSHMDDANWLGFVSDMTAGQRAIDS